MNDFILFLWQAPVAPSNNGGYMNIVFLIAAIVIIYFMMIRPQSQQRKKQLSFASSLKKGKKIVTVGGLHGVIAELSDTTVELIIAPKTHVTLQREAISMEYTNAAYGQTESTTTVEKQPESK